MITALLATVALSAPLTAEDFFPLVPGTKWIYEEQGGMMRLLYTDEVKEPVEVGGIRLTPVQTKQGDKVVETVYYQVTPTAVAIGAYDMKALLSDPRPVFKVDGDRTTWEFSGTTPFVRDQVPLFMRGEAKRNGKKKVLGEERETLMVKIDATVAAADGVTIKSKQTAYYAAGVGLYEMREEGTIGSQVSKRSMILIKRDLPPPKP